MNPVKFKECNGDLAKGQPQYRPLPVHVQSTQPSTACVVCFPNTAAALIGLPDPHCANCRGTGINPTWKDCTFKYELSDLEIAQIIKTKSLWFSQSGYGFNPVLPAVESPFLRLQVTFERIEGGLFNAWVPLDDGSNYEVKGLAAEFLIDDILNRFSNQIETADQIMFIEKPGFAIDEGGNITDFIIH